MKTCSGIGVAGSSGAYGDDKIMLHRRRLFYTGWSVGGVPYYSCPVAHIERCEEKLAKGEVTQAQVDAERKRLRVKRAA